jgi:hypothetical protein
MGGGRLAVPRVLQDRLTLLVLPPMKLKLVKYSLTPEELKETTLFLVVHGFKDPSELLSWKVEDLSKKEGWNSIVESAVRKIKQFPHS